jgi:hypothetical protein
MGILIKNQNIVYSIKGNLGPYTYILSRSGAMLLGAATPYGYPLLILQLNSDYWSRNISFLPEYLEDHTLAIVYQNTGVTGMANPIPVVKVNRINIYDDETFIGKTRSINTCLDLSKILSELYSLYPNTTIHLRVANGIYIDNSVKLRGNTILEGTFYINQDKIGTNNYVFSTYTITNFSATATNGNYYYAYVTGSPPTGPADYFYGYKSTGELNAKYKIIENVNKDKFLVYCEQPPTTGNLNYELIADRIIFKNAKFIPFMHSNSKANLIHYNLNVSFENCFISKSIIRGKSIKTENCEFENTYFNIERSEKLEIIESKALNTADGYLIEGNPLYPCKIIIENNDLSVYTTAEALFKSNFNFTNTNLTKIIIENNNLQDSYIDAAYTNILRTAPLKIRMHEGSIPSSLFITQGNRYRIVTGTKEQAKTFGTPYYGPDGLEKAFNDINPYETIVVKGKIGQVTGNPIKVINVNQKPFSIIGDTGDASVSPNEAATLYRIGLIYTPNVFPAKDIIEIKNLNIERATYDEIGEPSFFVLNLPNNVTYSFDKIEFKNCHLKKLAGLIDLRNDYASDGSTLYGNQIIIDGCNGENSTLFYVDTYYRIYYKVINTIIKNCVITINENLTGKSHDYGMFIDTWNIYSDPNTTQTVTIMIENCHAYLQSGSVNHFVELGISEINNNFNVVIDRFYYTQGSSNANVREFLIRISRSKFVHIINSTFQNNSSINACLIWAKMLQVRNVISYNHSPFIYFNPSGLSSPYYVVCLSNYNFSNQFIYFAYADNVNFIKVGNYGATHQVGNGTFANYVEAANIDS